MSRLRDALRLLRRTYRPVFGYLLVAGALTSLVLMPFAAWLFAKGLTLSGAGAVLNYAIADLATSIPGILLGLLWALATASLVVFVFGGPIVLTAAARSDRPTTARAVVGHVVRSTSRVPGIGGLKLAVLTALVLPLVTSGTAALAAIALIPFGANPLAELLSEDLMGLTVIVLPILVLTCLGFLLYVRWCFAFHILLFERVSLTEAIRRSVALNRKASLTSARALLAHHLSQALLLAVATFVLGFLEWLALRAVDPDSRVFAVAIALLLVVHSAGLGLVFLFGLGREAALLTNLYFERQPEADEQVRTTLAWSADDPAHVDLFRGRTKRLVAIITVLFLCAVAVTVPQVLEEVERASEPMRVTAHRGSSAEAPQNTMAAFRLAIEDGADYAELDVHQAKDGTLAVIHDTNLKSLAGVDVNVYDLTREDLAKLEVGSHFDERFRGEPIPTLEDVIRLAKGRLRLNIELKTHGREQGFEASVVKLIRELDFQDGCVITSLDQAALAAVRAVDPTLRIGMIITAMVGDEAALDVDFYSVQPLIATVSFIRRAHRHGREVHVWTINDREAMTRFADRGADGFITDYPRLAREVLRERDLGDEIGAALTRLFRS